LDILLLKLTITFFLAFIIAVIIAPPSIAYMHKLKFGQEIRDEGPAWHSKKSGTPTMGGIIFIISCTLATLIMAPGNKECSMLIFLSVSLL
jgi:phospho-N-acetylmuramoyl-pentapeptide-transferase